MKRDVFNAIADPTRRSILISLMDKPKKVNTIAEQFDITRQAVSLHIRYLQECGAIKVEKVGRERFCNIEVRTLEEVAHWIEPFRKMWEGKLNKLEHLLDEMRSETKLK